MCQTSCVCCSDVLAARGVADAYVVRVKAKQNFRSAYVTWERVYKQQGTFC